MPEEPKIKKPGTEAPGNYIQPNRRKDTSKIDVLLTDFGIMDRFAEISRIAETRQNECVKNRLLQLNKILKQEIAELIEVNRSLHARVEDYKKAERTNDDYLAYLQANGIDYQFWYTMYLTDIGISNTLKRFGTFENQNTGTIC